MQLYIVRHGDAVAAATGGYAGDAERPLSEVGRREVTAVAEGLQRFGLRLDLLLTSPLLRARQTAELVSAALPVAHGPVVSPALAPAGDLQGILTAARAGQRVMVVGHLPLLGELIGWLVWGDPALAVRLPTAGLGRVDLEPDGQPGAGELRWLLPPRLASRLR